MKVTGNKTPLHKYVHMYFLLPKCEILHSLSADTVI